MQQKNITITFILIITIAIATGLCIHIQQRTPKKDHTMFSTKLITTPSGIQLNTETFGNKNNQAILLIAGAMAPARFWIDDFCIALANNNYFVIRYDHRDMGLSSPINYTENPYTLETLTADAIAILDEYKIKKAHIIGHSMGGAIAQILALDYPSRVLSITLISSAVLTTAKLSNQEKESLAQTWSIMESYNKPNTILKESIDGFMKSYRYLHGNIPMDDTIAQAYITDMYQRSRPEHIAWFEKYSNGSEPLHNHVKAQAHIIDRTNDLKKLTIPTLIIHGEQDPLIAERLVRTYIAGIIPHAQMHIIPGMGHMILNRELFMHIKDIILNTYQNSEL